MTIGRPVPASRVIRPWPISPLAPVTRVTGVRIADSQSSVRYARSCTLALGTEQALDFLAHACQVLERALGCRDSGHQIVATGSAAARDLGGEVARRGRARLTDATVCACA